MLHCTSLRLFIHSVGHALLTSYMGLCRNIFCVYIPRLIELSSMMTTNPSLKDERSQPSMRKLVVRTEKIANNGYKTGKKDG